MELMKRKRNGEVNPQLTESSDSGSNEEDEEELLAPLDHFSDEEETPPVKAQKGKTRGSCARQAKEDEDDDEINDENFIVEAGTDDELGVPAMPIQFTKQFHKPLKEHFKDAVEWMVHRRLDPAFPMKDEIYQTAFRRLDDEYRGLALSKFLSTQWTREFTIAIKARPYLEHSYIGADEGIDKDGYPKCDVCNHRKHVPVQYIRLHGSAYNMDTLDPLEREDEDEDEDEDTAESDEQNDQDDENDSRSSSRDREGSKLCSQEKRFNSGRICLANAQQAHKLIHWKFRLYEWTKGELEVSGELAPGKAVQLLKMTLKKRSRYANEVVDKLERDGNIKSLYSEFKSLMDTSRELVQDGRNGWVKG